MAYKNNDEVLNRTAEDEPIFILVARDRLCPVVVQFWIDQAETIGVPQIKIDEARDHLDTIVEWQETHATKVPD